MGTDGMTPYGPFRRSGHRHSLRFLFSIVGFASFRAAFCLRRVVIRIDNADYRQYQYSEANQTQLYEDRVSADPAYEGDHLIVRVQLGGCSSTDGATCVAAAPHITLRLAT